MKKLYVGNLSYKVKQEELESLFSEYGNVSSAVVISDKFTGRSKGFGFVEMEDPASADKAIQELDGKAIQGRNLKVNEAQPRKDGDRNRNRRPRKNYSHSD